MDLARFMRIYTYLPFEERKLTVLIIEEEPINWARAYKEIKDKTPLGERVFKKLIEKDLI